MIVRSDLPLGFLAAQVVHAAGESAAPLGKLDPGTNAVVLAVPDESTLAALGARLAAAGVWHAAIYEPDAPWLGALTAIGLAPQADRAALRPLLSSLPLLGKEGPSQAA